MKVYVNKDKDGKYIAENYERLYDLRYAEMFNDYEIALCYCPTDCQVVEVQLMETTELTDYTKRVRQEVCETIKSDLLDFSHSYWRVFKSNGKQYMTDDDLRECLNEILNQIQGEKK